MNLRSSDSARRAGLLAVAAALAAGLAFVGKRIASREGRDAESAREQETYTCQCGAEYRVSGSDRHRVYWPAGAPDDAPVLGELCTQCEAPLPGGRTATAA